MTYRIIASILVFLCINTLAQKTILLEKIGTSRKYYYHVDDKIKLRTKPENVLIRGRLWSISDSVISISGGLHSILVHNIGSIYKQYGFPHRLTIGFAQGAVYYFLVLSFNGLINKEQVFKPYTFIITGSCIAGSLISFSLSESRFKIGNRWKLKILDFTVK